MAGLQVPPTTDKDALIEAIDNFSTARGTAIGSAILTSIDGIAAINPTVAPTGVDAESAQRSGYAPDVIVVLTDGANTQGVEPARPPRPRPSGASGSSPSASAPPPRRPDGLHRSAGRRLGRRRRVAAVGGGGGRSPLVIDEESLQAVAEIDRGPVLPGRERRPAAGRAG